MTKNDQDAKVTAPDEKKTPVKKAPAAKSEAKPAEQKKSPKESAPKASETKSSKSEAKAAKEPLKNASAAKNEAKPAEVTKSPKESAPKAEKATRSPGRYRLRAYYLETVAPALMKEFRYKNVNEVPRLEKISLNMRLGDVKDNSKSFNIAVEELATIAGQKPIVTKAKKSVANFKVREGMNLGAKVTLRGERMYEFFDKLVSIALPRVRDFRGVTSKSFDGRGNYSMGIKEQLIFPEINYDLIEKIRGFDIVCVTSAKTDEEARELLRKLGMPFRAD